MTITRLNPPTLHPTAGYAHITLVDAHRFAVLAGQCPLDGEGNLVGRDDLLGQVDQLIANASAALAAAGTAANCVVRSVIYVVSAEPTVLSAVWQRLTESALAPAFTTASTLLGVCALGYAGQLVELDLTAVIA